MNKSPAQTYKQQTAPSFPHVTVHIPENKRKKETTTCRVTANYSDTQ